MGRINRYIWFLVMIIIGGGIGLYYAWYIKPAEFVDAAMYNLRQDYKTDYVLMVAEIYDQDHDRYHAMIRLDEILDQNETTEEAVQTAIRHAEGFGYNPVDLEKMRTLNEVVTGQRSTPTPQYDPTMVYSIQMTSTAISGPADEEATEAPFTVPTDVPTNEPVSESSDGAPAADSDPFGTGIQITTDPNALPELNLPSAPTITPNPGLGWSDDEPEPSGSSNSSSANSDNFGGLPDSFFEGR